MRKYMYKFVLNLIFMLCFVFLHLPAGASGAQKSFVSISPAMTEIMYALGADYLLKAVSDECSYPPQAASKPKIGSGYLINDEKILRIHPNYILALDSSEILVNKFKKFNITPLCFKYPNIESVQKNILKLGELTGKTVRAKEINSVIARKIENARAKKKKKVLYLLSVRPMITAGKPSFINDIIEKAGMINVSGGVNIPYPVISEEFAISKKPDVIVVLRYLETKRVEQLFPGSKIVILTTGQEEVINRPGPRIYKAVEFFSGL